MKNSNNHLSILIVITYFYWEYLGNNVEFNSKIENKLDLFSKLVWIVKSKKISLKRLFELKPNIFIFQFNETQFSRWTMIFAT